MKISVRNKLLNPLQPLKGAFRLPALLLLLVLLLHSPDALACPKDSAAQYEAQIAETLTRIKKILGSDLSDTEKWARIRQDGEIGKRLFKYWEIVSEEVTLDDKQRKKAININIEKDGFILQEQIFLLITRDEASDEDKKFFLEISSRFLEANKKRNWLTKTEPVLNSLALKKHILLQSQGDFEIKNTLEAFRNLFLHYKNGDLLENYLETISLDDYRLLNAEFNALKSQLPLHGLCEEKSNCFTQVSEKLKEHQSKINISSDKYIENFLCSATFVHKSKVYFNLKVCGN